MLDGIFLRIALLCQFYRFSGEQHRCDVQRGFFVLILSMAVLNIISTSIIQALKGTTRRVFEKMIFFSTFFCTTALHDETHNTLAHSKQGNFK